MANSIIEARCMAFGKYITEASVTNTALESIRQDIITIGNKRRAGHELTSKEVSAVIGALAGYTIAQGYNPLNDVDTHLNLTLAAVLLHDEISKGLI